MFTRIFVLLGIGLFLLWPSCSKHPTSGTPTPESEYAIFWGTWQAPLVSNGTESAKFRLLLNKDTTFSFSQVADSSGAVSSQDSGTYHVDTASKVIRLVTPVHEGDYSYRCDSLILNLTWVSGQDYMNAFDRASATWEFFRQ
jgi:hypothetical protein